MDGINNTWAAILSGMIIFFTACSSPKVNFRFALKKENYKEVTRYDRLKTDKTEVTSTYIQMEGPAWENNHIAFRNYFDERNGMDIFGKKTTKMVLDKVGIDQNYHEMQDWGMDILKVGNSLGAGAIGLIIGDSLYRIGRNAKSSFQLIKESKKEVVFVLNFDDWHINGRTYNISHTITIRPNTHHYENVVQVTGLQGDEKLAVGIVSHIPEVKMIDLPSVKGIYTHGPQTMLNEYLGMGITTEKRYFDQSSHSDNYKGEIGQTHIAELKFDSNHEVKWRFFAGWELGDLGFKTEKYFKDLVMSESK